MSDKEAEKKESNQKQNAEDVKAPESTPPSDASKKADDSKSDPKPEMMDQSKKTDDSKSDPKPEKMDQSKKTDDSKSDPKPEKMDQSKKTDDSGSIDEIGSTSSDKKEKKTKIDKKKIILTAKKKEETTVKSNDLGTLKSYTASREKKLPKKGDILFVGRRKTAVARVKVISGKGKITINKRDLKNYFKVKEFQHIVKFPLILIKKEKEYDVSINVFGGGIRGQAEASSLGIAKGLSFYNEELRKELRSKGLLTRDSRMVERKKYGLHKARRAPQFSKR